MLCCGYAWFNTTYVNPGGYSNSDQVTACTQLHQTIEFISILILDQYNRYNNSKYRILVIGREGHFVASEIRQRVIQHSLPCTVVQSGQPAQLSHITYNRELIGSTGNYSCIPPSVKSMLSNMVEPLQGVQGT